MLIRSYLEVYETSRDGGRGGAVGALGSPEFLKKKIVYVVLILF